MREIIGKRGSGPTLTWFVATIIIFLMVVVFMIFAFSLAGRKNLGNSDEFNLNEKSVSKLALQKELIFFLNQEIVIDGKEKTRLELIVNEDDYKKEIEDYQNLLDWFFRGYYDVGSTHPNSVSLGVFGKTGLFWTGGAWASCNLDNWENIFAEQVIYDKKIVLCLNGDFNG